MTCHDNHNLDLRLLAIADWLAIDNAEIPSDRAEQARLQARLQVAVTGLTYHLSRVNMALASRNTVGGVRMGDE